MRIELRGVSHLLVISVNEYISLWQMMLIYFDLVFFSRKSVNKHKSIMLLAKWQHFHYQAWICLFSGSLSVCPVLNFPSLYVCSLVPSHTADTGIPTIPVTANHTILSKITYVKFVKSKHLWTIRLLIDYLIDYALQIIPINRLWKSSDYTTLVLYQVCVFPADRNNKMAALASDWLRHCWLLFWNDWTEFNETW